MKGILVLILVFGFILAGCTTTTETTGGGWDLPSGPVECSDTDGGKDIFNAGTVSFGEERGIDRCLGDGEKVMEYYCSGGQMMSEDIECPAGQKCYGGECREIGCFDTDGGAVESIMGTVSYDGKEYTDVCLNEHQLKEYSCGEGEVTEEIIECGSNEECSGGKCIALPQCSDSDGGDEAFVKGTTTYGSMVYEDYCLSYNVVYEYYCEDGALKQKQVVCPDEMDCENGYCVEAGEERGECEDTDGGKSRYKKGTITYWVGNTEYSESDKCYDDDSVLEVWCTEDGGKGFGILECDSGEWCEDGECTDG